MILVVLIAFFVIAGISIKYFKQDWLISYYVKFTSEEKKTTDMKWIRNVFGNLCFVVAGIMIISGFFSIRDSKVIVASQYIKVESVWGVKQPINEIKEVSLKNTLPKVLSKNGGSGLASVLKGQFTLEGLGKGRVYATIDKPPFIYITTDKSYIIINYKEPNRTKELYKTIKAFVEKQEE